MITKRRDPGSCYHGSYMLAYCKLSLSLIFSGQYPENAACGICPLLKLGPVVDESPANMWTDIDNLFGGDRFLVRV